MTAMPRTHFLGCIPVHLGALVLGYFQANVAGVGILVGVSYFMVILYQVVVNNFDTQREFKRKDIELPLLLLLFSVLCFIMAIYLIIGVRKRHRSYVLGYFMSGVVTATGMALLWMKLVFYEYYSFFDDATLNLFISFFLYLPFLSMVHSLYYNICLQNDSSTLRSMGQENSVEGYTNDVYYATLNKNPLKDIEKNSRYITLQGGYANNIKMDVPYVALQKDTGDDVEKDTYHSPLEEAYANYVKIDLLIDALQKDSVNDANKDTTYNMSQEECQRY
ncbi:hypothetical protein EVAR_55952_1 [Eumeta japonica]|uniref:Uncharacterized protein n=1 Tax=Eumeta variegata TaxID=151549 RepID=A0A4C1YVB3_EUMVA|nr:hypothetical protein EVAR_55952_1 [Eumeta japonica]